MGLTVLDAGVVIAGLDSDDAHHAAAAVEVGADHLLTTDQRWTALRRLGLRARLTVVRALAKDVDTTRMPRAESRKRNEAAGIGAL